MQPKKSVEFLGAEFVGDLQRDKQDLGHWNFIQRCLPRLSQNRFCFFLCAMYAWGLCPFLGMDIYSEKNLVPRNLSGINLGTPPRRHHTQGSLAWGMFEREAAFSKPAFANRQQHCFKRIWMNCVQACRASLGKAVVAGSFGRCGS